MICYKYIIIFTSQQRSLSFSCILVHTKDEQSSNAEFFSRYHQRVFTFLANDRSNVEDDYQPSKIEVRVWFHLFVDYFMQVGIPKSIRENICQQGTEGVYR